MTSLKEDGVDDTFCALVNIITAIIALFIYLLILAILRIRKDRFSAPVFSQMFHMGIADCIQLLIHLFGGVVTLVQFDMPTRLNQV
uniref:G_PROTEIN_RECEP_F1_2 domain-containing protein n=1 Tax=Panagrellus redivivus TaxID=6233 RepID=A0A7E4ZU61_PANRE